MKRPKQKNQQRKRSWQPLQKTRSKTPWAELGMSEPLAVYVNDLYSVFVREIGNDALHVSFHRHDRKAIRDWRHFQAIKNEVAGPERLAVEVFPPESRLVDEANEYHLWVFPPHWEEDFPFLLPSSVGCVLTQEEVFDLLGTDTKARQRDWQPGLPTGRSAIN